MAPPTLQIVKVCGITQPADALSAARAGATAIGLIFYPRSPRAVTMQQAALVAAVTPRSVLRVGVFVNETPETIRALVEAAQLDIVQLHGDETPDFCAELHDLRLWKALPVTEKFDPASVSVYPVEAVLLDTPAGDRYGGAGRTFPWAQAAAAREYKKVIVAGGLDGSNVAEAVRQAAPWGVDASSKLEARPGVKDAEKIRDYVDQARRAAGWSS
ncbi:MAG: N-(5'-phosphoribosyl)anthranilate isomerase [Acidobacteria bacterium]|nr:N-(5'-phosphoribosyl)anthranilate isomerase [Acidobacteriota bacterium]